MVFNGEPVVPVTVAIIDDDTVEEPKEDFTIILTQFTGHPTNIIPVDMPITVIIIDNDSKYMDQK